MKLDFDTADRTAIPAAYKWRMEDIFPDKAAYERALGDVETKLGEVAACAGRLAEPGGAGGMSAAVCAAQRAPGKGVYVRQNDAGSG